MGKKIQSNAPCKFATTLYIILLFWIAGTNRSSATNKNLTQILHLMVYQKTCQRREYFLYVFLCMVKKIKSKAPGKFATTIYIMLLFWISGTNRSSETINNYHTFCSLWTTKKHVTDANEFYTILCIQEYMSWIKIHRTVVDIWSLISGTICPSTIHKKFHIFIVVWFLKKHVTDAYEFYTF